MQWELSEEQELYTTSLREWLQERADTTTIRHWLDSDDHTTFQQLFVEEDWAGVGFNEAVGGQGGGLLELALTARELGRVAAPSTSWLNLAIISPALTNEPTILRAAITKGEETALATRADRIPQASEIRVIEDRLSGHIPHVLNGARAARLLVPVADQDTTSLWIIDSTAPGIEIRPEPLLDRSREVAEITLHNTPARRLEVDADQVIDEISNRAAVLIAADALGAYERMLTLTVEYSKQRQQFGVPIGSFQAVKHYAAQMLVTVESSMSIAFYAAQSVDDDLPDCATHAAVAKSQITGHATELADSALTLHGAIGYTWEHDLHLFYKRAKLDGVLFGTPTSWNERIAQSLQLIPASA